MQLKLLVVTVLAKVLSLYNLPHKAEGYDKLVSEF